MNRTALTAGLVLLGALLAVPAARADDDDDEHEATHSQRSTALPATPQLAAYTAECGSCHLAYPPRLLPAKSWRALLGGLDNHFGQNAEVDAATRAVLEPWLAANAGPDVAGTPLRITQLSWWRREHDEVSAAVYKRKAITSPANCAACHSGANQGAFGEHEVRIPRDAPASR